MGFQLNDAYPHFKRAATAFALTGGVMSAGGLLSEKINKAAFTPPEDKNTYEQVLSVIEDKRDQLKISDESEDWFKIAKALILPSIIMNGVAGAIHGQALRKKSDENGVSTGGNLYSGISLAGMTAFAASLGSSSSMVQLLAQGGFISSLILKNLASVHADEVQKAIDSDDTSFYQKHNVIECIWNTVSKHPEIAATTLLTAGLAAGTIFDEASMDVDWEQLKNLTGLSYLVNSLQMYHHKRKNDGINNEALANTNILGALRGFQPEDNIWLSTVVNISNAAASSTSLNLQLKSKTQSSSPTAIAQQLIAGSLLTYLSVTSLDSFRYDKGQEILQTLGLAAPTEQFPKCPLPSKAFPYKMLAEEGEGCLEIHTSAKEFSQLIANLDKTLDTLPMEVVPYLNYDFSLLEQPNLSIYDQAALQPILDEIEAMDGNSMPEKHMALLEKKLEGYPDYKQIFDTYKDQGIGPTVASLQAELDFKVSNALNDVEVKIAMDESDSKAVNNARISLLKDLVENSLEKSFKTQARETISSLAKLFAWSTLVTGSAAGISALSASSLKQREQNYDHNFDNLPTQITKKWYPRPASTGVNLSDSYSLLKTLGNENPTAATDIPYTNPININDYVVITQNQDEKS